MFNISLLCFLPLYLCLLCHWPPSNENSCCCEQRLGGDAGWHCVYLWPGTGRKVIQASGSTVPSMAVLGEEEGYRPLLISHNPTRGQTWKCISDFGFVCCWLLVYTNSSASLQREFALWSPLLRILYLQKSQRLPWGLHSQQCWQLGLIKQNCCFKPSTSPLF